MRHFFELIQVMVLSHSNMQRTSSFIAGRHEIAQQDARRRPLTYEAALDSALQRLHDEGRYRTFIDIERKKGHFPHATWRKPDGTEKDITVWCGNDYLGDRKSVV